MRPIALIALLAACALTGAGCGAGEEGPATSLIVTGEFGGRTIVETVKIPATPGLTVMRQLQGAHESTTSFGGRYVDSIEGTKEDGENSWLFYVDGVETTTAATSERLQGGEVVQWDFHPWQAVRIGGAIVGAYPQPMKSRGAEVVCSDDGTASCAKAKSVLRAAGVATTGERRVRVYVGSWGALGGIEGVPDLDRSGDVNGAFAQFTAGGKALTPFAADGSRRTSLGAGAGLLAAFAEGSKLSWVVTGTDDNGALAAAMLLERPESIANRFGAVVEGGNVRALPESVSP
jgi:hypothetical protein